MHRLCYNAVEYALGTKLLINVCCHATDCGFLLCVGNTPLHIAVMLGHKGK